MALPNIAVNALNQQQGGISSVEKYFLYVGQGLTNQNKLVFLNTDSDFDALLGEEDSELKRQVVAAFNNAGQNWNCVAIPLADGSLWNDAVDMAMSEDIRVESIVLTTPITAAADLTTMHTKAMNILAKYGRRVFFTAAVRGIDSETESWTDYITAVNNLTDNISAFRVSPVPYIYDDAVGIYAGRLCNIQTSVADTPMRVLTGPLIGQDHSTLPLDKDGQRYDMGHAKALNDQRLSVPAFFPDYPGVFWSDGELLDAPGGDYQVIENLRVVDKAGRLIRIVLIGLIGNRQFNTTPIGTEWAIGKLMKPLLSMSKSTEFNGIPFPAEIRKPTSESIKLNWISRTKVEVFYSVRPFECPKDITANIVLDLADPIQ